MVNIRSMYVILTIEIWSRLSVQHARYVHNTGGHNRGHFNAICTTFLWQILMACYYNKSIESVSPEKGVYQNSVIAI